MLLPQELQLKEKKIGLIVVGGSPLDNIQYELICKQFDCMASYLSWDMLFQKCYYANARDELAKDVDAIQKLENLGKNDIIQEKYSILPSSGAVRIL